MTCTLDVYTDYLLSSTGQTSGTGLSRLFDGAISHDQVTRLLTTAYWDSKTLWQQAKPLIRQAQQAQKPADYAVLIVDDSVLEKAHTDANAMICTHWDHSQGRYVKGLNFVTLLYQAGAVALPIAAELIEKTEPYWDERSQQTKYKSAYTKNEYLRRMLRVAQPQVAYRYLLADSWYASAENMAAVRALGHHFIFALEASRTVARSAVARKAGQFQALSTLAFADQQPQCVYLRSREEAVLVSKQVFINKEGDAAVGRGAVLEGVEQEAELGLGCISASEKPSLGTSVLTGGPARRGRGCGWSRRRLPRR